ncbi:hypothetical protein K9N50_11480 [bacterium]|nr:hypothetical protein [bacterium]
MTQNIGQGISSGLIGILGVLFGVIITTLGNWIIAKRQQSDQFRLAAIDKRLKAHQDAFCLCIQLINSFDKVDLLQSIANKSWEWWSSNCLYLDEKSSNAFKSAIISIKFTKIPDLGDKCWDNVQKAANIIANSAGLPTIGEIKPVKQKTLKEDKSQ